MKKQKIVSLSIILMLMASIFVALSNVQPVQATFSPRTLQCTWSSAVEFQRPFCYNYESICDSYYSPTYYDTAIISTTAAQLDDAELNRSYNSEQWFFEAAGYYTVTAYLHRCVTVYDQNGYVDSSGDLAINSTSFGAWLWGTINLKNMDWSWSFWDGLYLNGPNQDGLTYYFDIDPNQDRFQNHLWSVDYYIEVDVTDGFNQVQIYAYKNLGVYWNLGFRYLSSPNANAQFVHDERTDHYNWKVDPACCGQGYADGVAWSGVWGAGTVLNPTYGQGQSPNGAYAFTEAAYYPDSLGRICYNIQGGTYDFASGVVEVYGHTSADGEILVYYSSDGANWNFLGYGNLGSSDGWVTIGSTLGRIAQLIIVSYSENGEYHNAYIDCIGINRGK
jgi:hypothetical protein